MFQKHSFSSRSCDISLGNSKRRCLKSIFFVSLIQILLFESSDHSLFTEEQNSTGLLFIKLAVCRRGKNKKGKNKKKYSKKKTPCEDNPADVVMTPTTAAASSSITSPSNKNLTKAGLTKTASIFGQGSLSAALLDDETESPTADEAKADCKDQLEKKSSGSPHISHRSSDQACDSTTAGLTPRQNDLSVGSTEPPPPFWTQDAIYGIVEYHRDVFPRIYKHLFRFSDIMPDGTIDIKYDRRTKLLCGFFQKIGDALELWAEMLRVERGFREAIPHVDLLQDPELGPFIQPTEGSPCIFPGAGTDCTPVSNSMTSQDMHLTQDMNLRANSICTARRDCPEEMKELEQRLKLAETKGEHVIRMGEVDPAAFKMSNNDSEGTLDIAIGDAIIKVDQRELDKAGISQDGLEEFLKTGAESSLKPGKLRETDGSEVRTTSTEQSPAAVEDSEISAEKRDDRDLFLANEAVEAKKLYDLTTCELLSLRRLQIAKSELLDILNEKKRKEGLEAAEIKERDELVNDTGVTAMQIAMLEKRQNVFLEKSGIKSTSSKKSGNGPETETGTKGSKIALEIGFDELSDEISSLEHLDLEQGKADVAFIDALEKVEAEIQVQNERIWQNESERKSLNALGCMTPEQ